MPEQTCCPSWRAQEREVSYSGDPKVTHDCCRWNNRGQSCRNLGGQLDKRKETLIVDARNVEGAQDKHLWLIGGKSC